MKEAEMEQIANFLDEGVELAAVAKVELAKTGKTVNFKLEVSRGHVKVHVT